ncbi:hypothetical protein [Bdellovibrio sp. HCB2-146]|uniref:hypothetical protein n=1 Tax=Bdellovibrio sp. HCB2-146 TaxID=3394362 RepID=UPI0039BD8B0F
MKKLLLILAIGLGFTSTSHADILVEPYLGYEMGSGETSGVDFKSDGVNMGLRLGWKSPLMLWIAGEYNLGVSGNFKPDVGSDESTKRNVLGAVVGIDFPILLRGWIGYGFSNEIKGDNSTLKGTNTKIGVGFTGLPFVSLNFEYIKDDFKDVETSGGTTDFDGNHSSYMLSVSLPLEL